MSEFDDDELFEEVPGLEESSADDEPVDVLDQIKADPELREFVEFADGKALRFMTSEQIEALSDDEFDRLAQDEGRFEPEPDDDPPAELPAWAQVSDQDFTREVRELAYVDRWGREEAS